MFIQIQSNVKLGSGKTHRVTDLKVEWLNELLATPNGYIFHGNRRDWFIIRACGCSGYRIDDFLAFYHLAENGVVV